MRTAPAKPKCLAPPMTSRPAVLSKKQSSIESEVSTNRKEKNHFMLLKQKNFFMIWVYPTFCSSHCTVTVHKILCPLHCSECILNYFDTV